MAAATEGMRGAAVSLVLCADEPASRRAAENLFSDARLAALSRMELRPEVPFEGPLFSLLAEVPPGDCVGLAVPVALRPPEETTRGGGQPAAATPAPRLLLAVADHVGLELRGPLTGRWPAGVPRTFPPLTGIYQPAVVRACGVVVAGVADARRLTPFEAAAVREAGICAVSDTLVPPAIAAAYYGLTLAACGVPQTDDNDEE